ncbi:MAG: tRNA guanosine(34) transglycosylase Tgt [Pyrinomonadaceae bacterium MAG19_C2-C3]|nr:tRNA guanosine(34) transglycosylase Tgt [Pyrinomonadaceae bacterium MAG19_C2-C3]
MTSSNDGLNAFEFEITATEGAARVGLIQTRRGVIETPVFMPVGTQGTVKGVRFEALEAEELDARIILGNTYHLWLRPGADVIRACGGVHKFNGWRRAMLTDSGGFQVWSLGELRKITEDGVKFRSHIDGSPRFMSPEVSMEVQAALGSDIVMMFDECAPGKSEHDAAKRSMELTLRWGKRSRIRFDELQNEGMDTGRPEKAEGGRRKAEEESDGFHSSLITHHSSLSAKQALFGIVQGATHVDLRRESLRRTVEIGFDGYALGGLSVGEEKRVMYDVIEEIAPEMPVEKPRYLMGVGTPEDLIEGVARGVDMFDCVLPTRNARTGQALTLRGKLNIKNARFTTDTRPLDLRCACSVCRRHTRAYLRHLYMTGEMLASILLTHHNLFFFLDTMKRVRQAIRSHNFSDFRCKFLAEIAAGVE